MRKLFFISFLSFFSFNLSAQVIYDYLKAADAYFEKGDYNSAAIYYEKYLGTGKTKIKGEEYDPYTVKALTKQQKIAVSNKQQAIFKLAESYRHLNFHVKAEPYYAQAAKFDSSLFPLANYWHGKSLRALEKYTEAETAFNKYIAINAAGGKYVDDAKREIKNLQFIQQQIGRKDLALYKVDKTPIVNGEGANYAPVKVNGNTIWFTSTRSDSGAAKNNVHNNKVYVASYSDGVLNTVKKANLPATNQHQGVVSVTPDGNTVFLTRWTIAAGKKTATLYASKKSGDNWGEPTLLDNSVNVEGASVQQPFVMPDGKQLLYASDRKDGLGGFDIWSVDLDATGNPVTGTAKNLGAPINTSYDEQAPYYHVPTGSLVFSSNGNIGMGGYDFFQSKGTLGNWSTPENLGYPLNSVKDDLYFTSNGNAKNILGEVLFSSDRGSDCCLEMYALSKIRPLKQIQGLVVDCDTKQPLSGVSVAVTNSSNKVVFNATTSSNGAYSFTAEDFDALTTAGSLTGYKPNSVLTSTITNDAVINQTLNVLCLNKIIDTPPPPPPAVDTVVVMDNIYFAFNKAAILPESFDAIDNQIVVMMNRYPTMVIEIGGHTDGQGTEEYNMKLSQARAESVKKYLIEKGIAVDRIEAKGYGETKPVAPNTINGKDNPEGRKKNRRTEFKVLHY
jgi:outer membrane protein OmpA-like peptidoglycan-associated protein/tetratricopeptide (TPR) repeat protein